jgi:hypothetical protein
LEGFFILIKNDNLFLNVCTREGIVSSGICFTSRL